MRQVKTKDAGLNTNALNTASMMVKALIGAVEGANIDDFRFGRKHNGYSKQQLKDMVRIARLQLQIFSKELDTQYDYVSDNQQSLEVSECQK